jgi:hypothetical protein
MRKHRMALIVFAFVVALVATYPVASNSAAPKEKNTQEVSALWTLSFSHATPLPKPLVANLQPLWRQHRRPQPRRRHLHPLSHRHRPRHRCHLRLLRPPFRLPQERPSRGGSGPASSKPSHPVVPTSRQGCTGSWLAPGIRYAMPCLASLTTHTRGRHLSVCRTRRPSTSMGKTVIDPGMMPARGRS